MNDIKWIKVGIGLPDNRKIKKIRRLPDGNNIVLFWVFLLTKAGESNENGGLFFLEDIPYTAEDLADEFDFSYDFVKFAVITLEKMMMIEIYEHTIYIKNWEKYQNVEGMEKVRKLNAERNRKYRENKKQSILEPPENDVSVTSRDGTELELELDKDKEHIPYVEIVEYLNEKANKKFKHTTSKTREAIRGRWNEGNRLDDFKQVIDICCRKWSGQIFSNGQQGDKYLQPSTLFNGRFDERLNWVTDTPKITERKKSPEQVEHEKEVKEMQERIKANELSRK